MPLSSEVGCLPRINYPDKSEWSESQNQGRGRPGRKKLPSRSYLITYPSSHSLVGLSINFQTILTKSKFNSR